MEEEKTATEKIEHVRVGTRIIKQLSTTFYPKPEIIFDELVVNSRDAFARTLRINVGKEKITFEDDGQGMTPEELTRFFYISHSRKEAVRGLQSFKGVSRHIIGRFGIGKISMYQICKRFQIRTWRDGIESESTFDFEEFEKKEFVDDFDLKVKTIKVGGTTSGTALTMSALKNDAIGKMESPTKIMRHLRQSVPMGEDFKILFSGEGIRGAVEIKRDGLSSAVKAKYELKGKEVEGVGKVDFLMYVFKKESTQDYGVFIRVFDRLINVDPLSIINFNSLSHPRSFVNKMRVEVNANDLDEVLLTNRSGFLTTHPKYVLFSEWLEKTVKAFAEDYYKKWKEEKDGIEKKDIPDAVAESIAYFADAIPVRERSKADKATTDKAEVLADKNRMTLLRAIASKELKVRTAELGILEPEAVFEPAAKTLVLNSSNPAYALARSQGGLKGLSYHIFKAVAVLLASEVTVTTVDFKKIYDKYNRNVELLEFFKELSRRK